MLTKCLRLFAASSLLSASLFASADNRVLYVTHEPGRWHDYTSQRVAFEAIANQAGWGLTVASGDKDDLFAFLRSKDFAAGQDAIVYNFCLANSRDMVAMENLIAQTTEQGIPALLVHCAMHSWWDSFKKGKPIPGNELDLARANKRLLKQWAKDHPDRPLPAWGDFTGVASTKHGPKEPIALIRVGEHPATAGLPDAYATRDTELYNNHYITPGVQPLLMGEQDGEEAIVMWLAPRGASQVLGLTLGHADDEWSDPVFLQLLADSVNFLLGSNSPEQ